MLGSFSGNCLSLRHYNETKVPVGDLISRSLKLSKHQEKASHTEFLFLW